MNVERFLSQRDAATLCRLAEHLLRLRDVNLNCAERLIEVISNSILLPEHARRIDCVSLSSQVTYRYVGTHDARVMVVVCPHEADEALARMSILTPIALALVGRRLGSIVEVAPCARRVQYVEILAVQCSTLAAVPAAEPAASSTQKQGELHVPQQTPADQLPYLKEIWPRYGTW